MVAIAISPVNDAPSSTGGSVTGSEDDPYVFTAADFSFSDPAEGHSFFAVQITTLPAAGDILLNGAPVMAGDFIAVSAINAGMLTFQPDPDQFGSPYTTFTFRVQDSGGVLNGGVDTDPTPRTMTINVTPDNLPPEVDLNGAGAGLNASVSYTEDAPGVSIGTAIAVSDPNEGVGDLIESATITLTDAVAGDALTVTLPLPGGITAVTTTPAGQIVVTLSGPASTGGLCGGDRAGALFDEQPGSDPGRHRCDADDQRDGQGRDADQRGRDLDGDDHAARRCGGGPARRVHHQRECGAERQCLPGQRFGRRQRRRRPGAAGRRGQRHGGRGQPDHARLGRAC